MGIFKLGNADLKMALHYRYMRKLLQVLLFTSIVSAWLTPQPVSASLKRADMVVAGSSCAACLIRIEKKLKARPGVLKAMVSVYRPYAAIVVYDNAKTSMKDLAKVFAAENATAVKVVDHEIAEVPVLLLPLYK